MDCERIQVPEKMSHVLNYQCLGHSPEMTPTSLWPCCLQLLTCFHLVTTLIDTAETEAQGHALLAVHLVFHVLWIPWRSWTVAELCPFLTKTILSIHCWHFTNLYISMLTAINKQSGWLHLSFCMLKFRIVFAVEIVFFTIAWFWLWFRHASVIFVSSPLHLIIFQTQQCVMENI